MTSFKNFEVTEQADGQLIVTAKSGFAIRLASENVDAGIHVHAKTLGDSNRVYVVNSNTAKVTVRESRTVSFFKLEKA